MPFQEQTKMQGRQKLVWLVREGGWSVSQAAQACGVSRPTAYTWLQREQEMGLAALAEKSRRPHRRRPEVETSIQQQILQLRAQYPRRGARKLHAMLWPPRQPHQSTPAVPAPVSVRSVERILARAGLTQPSPAADPQWQRFERSGCNELWQIDFKGLEKRHGFRPLTLLDDCSRFCLALQPLQDGATDTVWQVLWSVFGQYGLPQCLLSDNGDGFNSIQSQGPTPLQARLWRLGIATTHGRVRHPQTQGKIERLHRSLEVEWAQELRPENFLQAQVTYPQVRHAYNWERPHQALGQIMPGVVYCASPRLRPSVLPPARISAQGLARKVDQWGKFSFHGRRYLAGRGLAGEWVEVREEAPGDDAEAPGFVLFYASCRIAPLTHICID